MASPLKRMRAEMSKLDEHVIKVYKSGSINLPQISAELISVKELCNSLNKYCDDVKGMVKQVEEAVKNVNNAKTKVNVATQKLKCPYKWKCNLTFRTTTNLHDHIKVSMKIPNFHAGKIIGIKLSQISPPGRFMK